MTFGALGSAANQVLIKINGDKKGFDTALSGADSSLSKFAAGIKSYAPMIGAAFAAAATGVAVYSVQAAMKIEQLERGFHSLAVSQGKDADMYLAKLKEASQGTVKQADIMASANQAMLLGLDLDTIAKMMEGATVIAQATGKDASLMFESLTMGVARQSPMLLDNLGIKIKMGDVTDKLTKQFQVSADALTQEQVAMGFQEAVMEGVSERMVALGGFTESTTSNTAQLTVAIDDMTIALGQELLPAVNDTVVGLTKFVEVMNDANVVSKTFSAISWPVKKAWDIGEFAGKQHRALLEQAAIAEDARPRQLGNKVYEQEIIDYYGLRSDRLSKIKDEEFEIMMLVMENAGYADKALQLEQARNYALSDGANIMSQTITFEQQRLNVAKETTKESEKQLTLMQKMISYYSTQKSSPSSMRDILAAERGETRKVEGGGTIYSAAAWASAQANKSGV